MTSKKSNWTKYFLFIGIISFIVVLLISFAAPAQQYAPSEPYKELDDRIKQFFDEIIANSSSASAFDSLLTTGSTTTTNSLIDTSISEMKTKLDDVKTRFGNFKDYEKIDAKPIGKDLVIIRYLLKCESYPVVWTFTFYRRPNATTTTIVTTTQWQTIGLRFDTNLDILILK
ncbi:MAG: hypothetical protein LBP59_13805 [Planctomycetaceae bacterium]|jgi:hypothetical protein|nr:hypothetical protein [Planctomycetaceae bacterium]